MLHAELTPILPSISYDQSTSWGEDRADGDVTRHTRTHADTRTSTIEPLSHREVFTSACVLAQLDWVAEAMQGSVEDGEISAIALGQARELLPACLQDKRKGVEHESSVFIGPRVSWNGHGLVYIGASR